MSSSRLTSGLAWALSLLLLLGIASGCGGAADSSPPAEDSAAANEEGGEGTPEEPALAVVVSTVREEPLAALYATSATLRAERRAAVLARTRGVIRELRVEEGDRVEADAVLAVLEDDEQRITYESAKTAFEILSREQKRAERVLEQGLLSEEEFETKRRAAEEARHALERAELELRWTRIRAPFRGRVLVRHLDQGATVADGTSVYEIADLDPLYADVSVPERHIARLRVGQEVRLGADGSGVEAEGRIERIGHEVDASTATVKVTVTVPPRAGLRPGGFVRVEVVTDVRERALVVPRSALVAEGRRWHIFRVGDDGEHAERLEVEPGYEERDLVEVLLQGDARLAPGDEVVTAGAPALSDGARITPTRERTAAEPAS